MNRPHRRWTVVAALGLAGACPAAAAPTLDLSWDNCAPLLATKVQPPGQTIAALYCSATGMDRAHRSYDVSLWFASSASCAAAAAMPDAWRFDAPGCQGGFAQVVVTNPQQACPPLSGPTRVPVFTLEYSPPDGLTPPGAMRLRVSVSYADSPQAADPASRRHVFAIRFDHEFSVPGQGEPGATCGGYEHAMCFALWPGGEAEACGPAGAVSTFVDTDGVEHPFAIGQGAVSFGHDAAAALGCLGAVPAKSATWGALKGSYR